MKLRPLPFMLVFAWGLASGPVAAKPQPGVTMEWDLPHVPAPGELITLQLVVTVRSPVSRLLLVVDVPAPTTSYGPLPSYDGSAPAGVLRFPVIVRAPSGSAPPLMARATIQGAVSYHVTALLDLSPLALEAPVPPRPIATPQGETLEFVEPGSVLERSPGGRGEPRVQAPREVRVQLLYRNRSIGPDGFLRILPERDPASPIRRADVDLIEVTSQGDVVIAQGTTDENGWFSHTADPAGWLKVRVYSSTARAPGGVVQVKVSTQRPSLYSAVSPTFLVGQHAPTFVVEPGQGGEAFNILDACVAGMEQVRDLSGGYPVNGLTMYWDITRGTDGSCANAGTYYHRASRSILLLCDEGYDDSVILHEFGHYVAHQFSRDESPGGGHYIDDSNQDIRLAWSEGWASYFQALTRLGMGDPYASWYVDTEGTPGRGQLIFSYDCEGPGPSVWGAGSEVVVQALLWDLVDDPLTPDARPDEDDDPLGALQHETWDVFAGPLRSASSVSLEDFWDGWFSPGIQNGQDADMRILFGALGAEYFPDPLEGEDPGGSRLALDGRSMHRTFWPKGDVDEHRFDLTTGESVMIETLNLIGHGDTRLTVRGPDGTVLAQADNRTTQDLSSEVNLVAPVTGAYVLRVERSFSTGLSAVAEYGSYDVRAVRGRAHRVPLEEIAHEAGILDAGFGVGVALTDYNGDGLPDIYVVHNTAGGPAAARDAFYVNQGNGRFEEILDTMGENRPEGGVAAAWGDYNGDGAADLFVTDHGLYRNEGGQGLVNVTEESGVVDIGREYDASWVDTDLDGLLDLYVVNREGAPALWKNRGDGTFMNIAPWAGFNVPAQGPQAAGCSWGDFDGDFLPDLCLTYRENPGVALYRNLGSNRFEDVTARAGITLPVPAAGAVWADFDGDGRLDLFLAGLGPNALFMNQGDGVFRDDAPQQGMNELGLSQGAAAADYDLDGDLDLFLANLSSSNLLFENVGGVFIRMNQAANVGYSLGCAWGDVDADGDPDLYVARGCGGTCETDLLYENQIPHGEGGPYWLQVKAVGQLTHRDARGAVIRAYSGDRVQMRQVGTGTGWASKSLLPETFGFPTAVVDSVEVLWPSNAARSVVREPALGQLLVVQEQSFTPVLPPGVEPELVRPFFVTPAFPNPFAAATTVGFDLDVDAPVRIEIYDLSGRRVRTVLDRRLPAGRHVAGWDGVDSRGIPAPAGLYFYRFVAGERTRVLKLVKQGT